MSPDAPLPRMRRATTPGPLSGRALSSLNRVEGIRRFLTDRTERARLRAERATDPREIPGYPLIHLAAPVGRLNDPNGLLWADGAYHAFYQYSPLHPEKAVFWRHATSTNLCDWEDRGTAMAPEEFYDSSGCYSGSGIVAPGGEFEFFYTGNVKDQNGLRETYQCLLTSTDAGESFEKSPLNPLIDGPAPGISAHMRDPDVSERDGGWMMLLGAQRTAGTGAIVRYDSPDRRTWTYTGPLETSDPALGALGYMIECPILLQMPDEATGQVMDVLIVCPQGMDAAAAGAVPADGWNAPDGCGYIVGHLEGTRFEVAGPLTELDAGFEFYAPQAFSHDPSRTLLAAWMGNPGQDDQPSLADGWVHSLTFPRELRLVDGRIVQRFARELETRAPLAPVQGALPDLMGHPHARVRLTAAFSPDPAAEAPEAGTDGQAAEVLVAIVGADGSRSTLRVGPERVRWERTGTHYVDGGDVRERALETAETREVEVLVDGSGVEILIDGGRVAMTGRVYVGELARIEVGAEPGAQIRDLAAARIGR